MKNQHNATHCSLQQKGVSSRFLILACATAIASATFVAIVGGKDFFNICPLQPSCLLPPELMAPLCGTYFNGQWLAQSDIPVASL
jgi:hypothetical protein